ncbi:MAG TPA: pyruvate dehydrogenase complex dihydrolipoamide acetyltransferase, partial [Lacunisphaera sp.]|nr:pyruvate dehydrogenase complex dihydrolipoamide acetyltransferase [Lacunisphaera sp.]
MADIIEMPKLSDTMTVGTLVKWLKKEGDTVNTGDMLAEVETDKATMELESFFSGTLVKIFADAGSQVAIGAALCAIGKPGEKVEAPAASAAKAPGLPATKPEEKPAEPQPEPRAQPSPAAPGGGVPPPRGNTAVPSPSPAAQPPDEPHRSPEGEGGRLRISPLARKLAAEQKIDPSRLAGSGPHGRIVKADVLAAAADPSKLKPAPAGGGEVPSPRGNDASILARGPLQEARTVPATNMRATIARRLLEAKTQIPHFYLEIEVDAEPLLAIRAQLNGGLEKEGVKLSVNDFILKASAEALRRVPAVNASWTGTGIQYHGAAHVSFAVAIEDGLITPVIRDTHLKSLFQISSEAKPLGKRAKEKKLKPEEFTGGTFCVSNLGMMGVERFSAIINPPNSAILAVGTTVTKPVVKNGQIVVGQTMVLTLSCDHRVVDGALGAQFLAA